MSESDLMNKFDAFIKKHHAAMVDEIPVLTDIVIEEETKASESSLESDSSLASINENDETAIISTEEFTVPLTEPEADLLIQSGEDFPVIQASDIHEEFPVLVDVYEDPEIELEQNASPLIPGSTEPSDNVSKLSDEEAEQLARDIYIRVMSEVDGRISRELRLDMSKRLSAMIDKTVAAAIEDFKQELANIVSDAISETLLQRTERNAKNTP